MDAEVDTGNATAGPPALRRRRFAVALVLLLAAAVVATVVLGTRSRSPRAADTGVSVGGAAIVQRRDLVETDTESGTLSYADPQTVYNRLNGTITWLPAVGELIRPGQTIYTVNGRAVVLLDGALPAYRVLKAKDTAGQDVLQLNSDLVQMGFADGQITIDDTWQTGTTDAVERWQASLGEKQTGEITLGRIIFLPGAQRVTQLDTTCGSTGGGAGGGSNSVGGSGPTNGCGISEASTTIPAPHLEFVDLTTSSTTTSTTASTTTTTPTTTTTTTTTTTPKHTKSRSGHKGGGSRKRSKRSGSGSGFSERSGNGAGGGKGSSGSGSGNGTGAGKSASGSGKSASGSGKGSGKDSGNGGSEGSASAILPGGDCRPGSQLAERGGGRRARNGRDAGRLDSRRHDRGREPGCREPGQQRHHGWRLVERRGQRRLWSRKRLGLVRDGAGDDHARRTRQGCRARSGAGVGQLRSGEGQARALGAGDRAGSHLW